MRKDAMKDYYAILHVLPTAEIDVIKAAYKALARKYHPDAFQGDKAAANAKMRDINEAYEVLNNTDKRKQYDEKREREKPEEDLGANGDDADTRMERDWEVAVSFCPIAKECHDQLNRLSRSLAFAFQSYLLDSKQFSECTKIRDTFRAQFLSNYFGGNGTIHKIGEQLILEGELAAAKVLNQAVKVMGASLRADQAIKSLQKQFPHLSQLSGLWAARTPQQERFLHAQQEKHPYYVFRLLREVGIACRMNFLNTVYIVDYQGKTVRIPSANFYEWGMNVLKQRPEFRSL